MYTISTTILSINKFKQQFSPNNLEQYKLAKTRGGQTLCLITDAHYLTNNTILSNSSQMSSLHDETEKATSVFYHKVSTCKYTYKTWQNNINLLTLTSRLYIKTTNNQDQLVSSMPI